MKIWLIAACVCSAAGVRAQGVGQSQAAPPLVNLSVVAKDAHGVPVTDLTRDDFQVFEGSKAQRVVSFRRNDAIVKRLMRAEPNEYSNRTGAPTARVTVILFDLLNARFEDRGSMMSQLGPALQHLEASETLFFYILTMNGTLYSVHGLPDGDREKTAGARPWTEDIKALLDDASRELFRLRPVGVDVDMRVRMTYQALGSLADLVAAAPGRKSLIWISHGVPISLGVGGSSIYAGMDYTPLLQRLTATLDRADVAVYTVRQPESLRPGGQSDAAAASPASGRWPGDHDVHGRHAGAVCAVDGRARLHDAGHSRRDRAGGERCAHELPDLLRTFAGKLGWEISQDPRDLRAQGSEVGDQAGLLRVRQSGRPGRSGESGIRDGDGERIQRDGDRPVRAIDGARYKAANGGA